MQFSEQDKVEIMNLLKLIRRAKFDDMQGLEALALSRAYFWLEALIKPAPKPLPKPQAAAPIVAPPVAPSPALAPALPMMLEPVAPKTGFIEEEKIEEPTEQPKRKSKKVKNG